MSLIVGLGAEGSAPPSPITEDAVSVSQMIEDEGYAVLGLSPERMLRIGNKFQEIFRKNNVSINSLAIIQGVVYALGSKKYGNNSWREHAAASVRTTLDTWALNTQKMFEAIRSTFERDGKIIPHYPKTDPDGLYLTMTHYYGYFSAVVHQDAPGVLNRLRDLGDKMAKPGDDTNQIFIEKLKSFFLFFEEFFNRYT